MNDLAELERLAREAQAHSERIGEYEWFTQASVQSMLLAHPSDAAYIAACSPETVLRLVSIAKAAERDAKDAARYRWLRDKALSAPEPCPWVVYGSDGNNADLIYGAELDAAIDAALIPPGCKPT